ncbi:Tudor domain-containing protein [Caenorhabditis elegans]|uniref:Tudor domain-containing protein n=1 Tax=Caenorhabditis elegans TaxID=6239 RepID=O16628_CAEEL|nr:Tudor domain-containing protein [Caenorhabditis elegans]CCD70876.1 Tudor domain-containing protein [Caenorhabditis elegans]|eukprot:NP_494289.2 Uncharacterized protein CELE_K02F6.7 [Caenorhabditis elegans]
MAALRVPLSQQQLEQLKANKKWGEYVEAQAGQKYEHFTSPYKQSMLTVKEWIMPQGLVIYVRTDDGTYPARVVNAGPDNICVRIVKANKSDPEPETQISYDQVIKSTEVLKMEPLKFKWIRKKTDNLYSIEAFQNLSGFFNKKVFELLKKGDFMEYQHDDEPWKCTIVEIIENHNGLIFIRNGLFVRCVHMFSPFCHELGWADKLKETNDERAAGMTYKILIKLENDRDQRVIVDRHIFRNNTISPHRFQDLQVLVYLEEDHFYLAHVKCKTRKTGLTDSYFFQISRGTELVRDSLLSDNKMPVQFHLNDARIFGYRDLERLHFPIDLPDGVQKIEGESNVDAYIRTYCLTDKEKARVPRLNESEKRAMFDRKILSNEIGVHMKHGAMLRDSKFNPTAGSLTPWAGTKCAEVSWFLPSSGRTRNRRADLLAARVVKYTEHIAHLYVARLDKTIYMHVADPRLHPAGFADGVNLPIEYSDAFAKDADIEIQISQLEETLDNLACEQDSTKDQN